jgi:hypothetical protein
MKYNIINNWNFLRMLRLIIGLGILYEAIHSNDIFLGLMGLLFAGMAILNVSCCGSGGCYVPANKNTI